MKSIINALKKEGKQAVCLFYTLKSGASVFRTFRARKSSKRQLHLNVEQFFSRKVLVHPPLRV